MYVKYSEKLKDPRWQKKRLEVFLRDEFTCQICLDSETTLNVHHKRYIPNNEPWDYSLNDLITLCENCHNVERDTRGKAESVLLEQLKLIFFSSDIEALSQAVSSMPLSHVPGVVMSAICWNIVNNQKELIDKYFKAIEK
jgi:hypothetical protein